MREGALSSPESAQIALVLSRGLLFSGDGGQRRRVRSKEERQVPGREVGVLQEFRKEKGRVSCKSSPNLVLHIVLIGDISVSI